MSKIGSLKRLTKQINSQVWQLRKKNTQIIIIRNCNSFHSKCPLSSQSSFSSLSPPLPFSFLLPLPSPPFSSLYSYSSFNDVLSKFLEPSHCGLKSGKPTNQNKPFCPEIISVRYFVSSLRKITNTENGYQE